MTKTEDKHIVENSKDRNDITGKRWKTGNIMLDKFNRMNT